MKVRFFAGAAHAFGAPETELDGAGLSARQALDQLSGMSQTSDSAHLAKVLAACSLLADGKRIDDLDAAVDSVAQLDVLPPFAGG